MGGSSSSQSSGSGDHNPHITYLPLAGRAELIRLIAAAGGVEITENSDFKNKGPVIAETGEKKADYMSPSGMPLLKHGELKMSQSLPIETYIAAIAPRYKQLTAQQRAIDNMYQAIKEDILAGCAKSLFFTLKTDKDQAKQEITQHYDKWLPMLEEKMPDEGYIQGLDFPTPADLAVLNITVAFMPFGATAKIAGYDFGKFPKLKAFCDRVAADPPVAEYLKTSKYTTANPLGL